MKDNNSNSVSVLVVDDDHDLLQLLDMRLTAAGFNTCCCSSGQEALDKLDNFSPSAVITDLKMDGMDGMQLLEKIHQIRPLLPVIMLTAHGSIPDAVVAAQKGVFAFLTKPINKQELITTLEQACNTTTVVNQPDEWSSNIITRSPRMFELLEQAKMVAQSNVSVFITGDSGTGKELLAQAIHSASRRHNNPFIPINCGAIPSELLESELFGHKKGAFTGANNDHQGLFQAADQGTLFLDEIGDMPLSLQVKLLRVLQEETVRPVGSTQHIPVDVRVIAATHRHIEKQISTGEFREDLFYRLNVVNLELPRLRDRKEDVPLLVNHFLNQVASQNNQTQRKFSEEAMQLLMGYHWPGNIRQLQNLVERTVALSPSKVISESLVRSSLPTDEQAITPLTEAKQAFERNYVKQLLKQTNGSIPDAAKLAGRNRSDFYKIVKRHNIDTNHFVLAETSRVARQLT
ncbi:sigma 54-interacting transcriptional regulator [Pleionea sediminis]|uniref:sigma 54-interacting transcriptional regulator n=1 Tax=Pleionea sediminis TaxID=2569479 RepID=UPI0011853657|nr:sigma 54-interacting transcriptional regulator [Pleionea sediminis]